MREDFWEFDPTHKVVVCTNHRPVVKGTDDGTWRRIQLVPFDVTIPREKQDKQLPAKLRAELPGILAWAVQGCLEWQRGGLQTPKELLAATEEYQAEQYQVAAFLTECCAFGEDYRGKLSALHDSYCRWTGIKAGDITPRQLSKAVEEYLTGKGLFCHKYLNNGTWIQGVALLPEWRQAKSTEDTEDRDVDEFCH